MHGIEEWASVSPRFVPQCIVPLAPVGNAVAELKRAVAKGHRGLVFPAVPQAIREGVPHLNDKDYDPLWAACQDLDIPLCFHAGPSREFQFPPYEGFSPELASALEALTRPVSSVLIVANFLFSQILHRFPRLKVIFAESSLAWGAYELELADHQYERQRLHTEGYALKPSELFVRNCHLVGWFALGLDQVPSSPSEDLSLSRWVEDRILPLKGLDPAAQQQRVSVWSRSLDRLQRYIFLKLVTGELRVGVSQTLVVRALAQAARLPPPTIAARIMGEWSPTPDWYASLLSHERTDDDRSRPYPFFLASPLEDPLETLGDVADWLVEWKWDGIRAQLVKRGGVLHLWSRGRSSSHIASPRSSPPLNRPASSKTGRHR